MDGALAARLIDTLGDEALLLLDPEGWIRWGSAAVLTVLGVSADELADRPLADLYPEDERALGLPARELREAQAHGRLVREGWTLRPDGSRFWALTTLTPLRDEAGMLTGFSRLVRDMDERVRVEETLRAAEARVSGIIALATDAIVSVDEELRIVLFNQAAEEVFGWTAEEVLGRPLSMLLPERFRVQHDRMMRLFADSHVRSRRISERPEIVGLRRDGTEFPAEASISQLEVGSRTLLNAVLRDVSERRRAEAETRALLQRERAARQRAEVSERRARMLAEATRLLSDYMAPEDTLAGIARLAAPELADCCAIHLVEGRHLSRIAFTHSDQADGKPLAPMLSGWRPPPGVGPAMARALRTREMQRVERPLELSLGDEVPAQATLCVPIEARGHLLGLITLCLFRSGADFTDDDVEIARELANHVALALDNAHLYRDAEHARAAAEVARRQIERLQRVTAALSEATTAAEVVDAVLHHTAELLGTHNGMIARVSADGGWLEAVRPSEYVPRGLDGWERFPVDATTPMGDAVASGQVVAIETAEAVCQRYPAVAGAMAEVGTGSLIAAPLIVDGRPLGALGLGFPEPRTFEATELAFLASVATQCALALERARLYEQEHAARDRAEAAVKARDEVQRIVAHDLGNSLSGVLTTASALTRILDARGESDALEAVRNIQSAAQQMHRLRRDLLDVAMIDAGQLSVIPAALPPLELMGVAAAQLHQLAAEKEIHLELDARGPLPPVLADRDRVLQVLANLLVNAVKFTPEGGRVQLAASGEEGCVRFSVRDSGPGIPAEHRQRVFDRFWRTRGAGNRTGAGLGLAIARGIVEAHGGRLWVEDDPGEGAEFAFTLPMADGS